MAQEKYYLVDETKNVGFPADITFGDEKQPAHLLTNTKLGYEYGLKVAKAIEQDWYGGTNCMFNQRQGKFRELRKYAMGEQEIEQYKKILCFEGKDMKWQNLDWSPLKILPKFVDIVVNGIQERLYALKAEAIDMEANKKRKSERDRIEKDMVTKDFMDQAQKLFGAELYTMPKEKLPLSDEELNIYMETEFKLPIEISVEKVMKLILKYNEIDTISERVIRDLVEIGVGGMRHYIDPVGGIKVKYLDPERTLHSYNEHPDFQGVYYYGSVETMPIAELKRMFITQNINWDDVKQQSISFRRHLGVQQDRHNKSLDNFNVDVLFFNYQTSKEIVFKQKIMKGNAIKMNRRDNNYDPPKDERYHKRVDTSVDTWMEGALIIGTDILLDWREASNLVRPKGNLHSPLPNYIMFAPKFYDGEYDSLVKRMIPPTNQIQLEHMKLQHLVSKINPDGLHFDVDGLRGIDLGDGGVYTPKEAMRLYIETGNTVGRSISEVGNPQNSKPVQPNFTSGQSDKIRNIITAMNFYMGQLVESVGANQQATNPDADALVGVQKIAALNSNQATRHIRNAILKILRGVGRGVIIRLKDAWEYSEFKEWLIGGLGRTDIETLEAFKDVNLHDVGIFIELRPDQDERMAILSDVNVALESGQIRMPDKIDILNIDNYKEQSQLLKVRISRYEKERKEEDAMKIKMNEESQINIARESSKARLEESQIKSQLKLQEIQAQAQGEIMVNEELAKQKMILMDKEYGYKVQVVQGEVGSKMEEKKYMEDRKDDRERMRATYQSEQSYQRKHNLPPQNFESKFDDMEGIGLK